MILRLCHYLTCNSIPFTVALTGLKKVADGGCLTGVGGSGGEQVAHLARKEGGLAVRHSDSYTGSKWGGTEIERNDLQMEGESFR